MGGGAVVAFRTLFGVLGCVMVATLIYTISTSGLPFHRDLLTRWMAATLLDFYINVAAIGAWVFYKESSWIMAVIWIVLLVCFGSITTCGYIVLQFFKLSPEESLEDPLYFVLVRRWRKDGTEQKKRHSVVGARIIFTALGFLMLGTLVYVGITDDSPLSDILTPWMVATLIDFYINVVALSVWVAYKESSWIRALVWIILLACFGSTATCAYIVWQLRHLSSQDPLYLVLFNSSNSKEIRSSSRC